MAQASGISIEPCTERDLGLWIALRRALWPEAAEPDLRQEAEALLCRSDQAIAVLARTARGGVAGFAEASLRHDGVNGCATSPVAFLEGIYVCPGWRRRGLASRLCAAVEDWARERQCREFASDALLDNDASHRMHRALGFEETERVVYFRKVLA